MKTQCRVVQVDGRFPYETKDCSVVAVSVACGVPYAKAHARLAALGRKQCCGVVFPLLAERLGLEEVKGLKPLRIKTLARRFPRGRYIVKIERHVFALVNGMILDGWCPPQGKSVYRVYRVVGRPVVASRES